MTTQTSLVEQARELLLTDTQKFYALMSTERRRIYGGDPSWPERVEVGLNGIDLSSEHISNISLGAVLGLRDICFEGADLTGASFRRCSFERSRFPAARMHARFDDCQLMSADLRGLLSGSATLINCGMRDINCEGADIHGLMAIRCNFDGAKMAGANMQGVYMDACTFDHADFTGADMRWADFRKSSIYGAKGLTRKFYRRHRLAVERSLGFGPK